MTSSMRHLASVLLEASNVADENERLKREMAKLRADIDKDWQRRQLQDLNEKYREAQRQVAKLTDKNKRLKQKAGEQKHKADMLEVKVKLQEDRIEYLKGLIDKNTVLEGYDK